MKKDIKKEILRVSSELFNERGYNEVSMRAISDRLEISVGNLTYHYKRKEDLVEAVLAEQLQGYQKPAPATTLVDLNDFFMRILSHQEENAYYFKHYKQLADISPKVYEIQKEVIQDLRDALEETFKNLKMAGLIRRDAFPDQTPCLIEIMMSICINGTVIGEMDRLKCLWSLVYPILR